MPLSDRQLAMLGGLVRAAPDRGIEQLALALAAGAADDQALAEVHALFAAELAERRARDAVLAPLLPQCDPALAWPKRILLPKAAISMIWRGLKAAQPDLAQAAILAANEPFQPDEIPAAFDDLCTAAAPDITLPGPDGDVAQTLAALVPVLRRADAALDVWLRIQTSESVAAMRLAYKDADRAAKDSGPLFMEALLNRLAEPWQILRVISAVMDRPSDRYLSESELAHIGLRLLSELDRQVETIRRFDPHRGFEGGVATAAIALTTTHQINEFEQWLTLKRDGPWGERVAAAKRNLSLAMEAWLREVEPALAAALPTQSVRGLGGRGMRAAPRLAADPDLAAVRKAEGLLALLDACRASAQNGGFASLRGKVKEALEKRIDAYVEDLLDQLHSGAGPDPERIRTFLDLAADFTGHVKDPEAARIVRRRSAAA